MKKLGLLICLLGCFCFLPGQDPEPNCTDLIVADFDPATGAYTFRLNSTDVMAGEGITWTNETDGIEIASGTAESVNVDFNVITGDCRTISICVRWYDRGCQCWRECCKQFCICRDPDKCQLIDYLVDENGFNFSLGLDNATNLQWYYEEDGQLNAINLQGELPFLDFGPENTCRKIRICCHYYDPTTNCWKWCCRRLCLCNPFRCDAIDYDYLTDDPNYEGFQFEFGLENTSQWQWSAVFEDGRIEPLGVGTTSDLLRPTDVCRSVLICCRYFDNIDECWKVCCRRIWLCSPVECEDIINCRFDPATGNYELSLNSSAIDIDLDAGITWVNETSGLEIGTDVTVNTTLELDNENCRTYSICVRYYDRNCACWRVCCKRLCLCREPEKCDFIDYQIEESGFRFLLSQDQFTDRQWYYEEDGQIRVFDSNDDQPFIEFGTAGQCRKIKICCRYFDPATGCWKYCCRTLCICNPWQCNGIDYDFLSDAGSYQFRFNQPNTNQWEWSVVFDDGRVEYLGNGASSNLLPPADVCRWVRICCRYFDTLDRCWKVCCRRVWLCHPRECEDLIDGRYNPLTGNYELSLNTDGVDIDLEAGITWTNETTGVVIGADPSVTTTFEMNDQQCRTYSICVRYYDRSCNCWRVCCKRFCVCRDQEKCDRIDYSVDENGYQFFLNQPDVTATQWYYEENGEIITVDHTSPFWLPFDPANDCRRVKVCCYYFDPSTQCWKWCCRKIEICRRKCCADNPVQELEWLRNLTTACDADGCGLRVYCCTYEGRQVLNVTDDPSICTDPLGTVYECDGTVLFQWGGIGGINMDLYDRLEDCKLIWKCHDEICDNGRDDDGDGKIDCEDEDCRDFCYGGCDEAPEAKFSAREVNVYTYKFKDQSTNDPDQWSWTFGDGGTSDRQNPRHRYDHPGTYEVCLVAANNCGISEGYCRKIEVSEVPGYEVIINIGEAKGNPGDIVDIPVTIDDCIDCSAVTSFEGKIGFDYPDMVKVLEVYPKRLDDGFFEWLPDVNGIAYTAQDPVNIPDQDTLFVLRLELVGEPGDQSVITLKTDFETEMSGKINGDTPREFDLYLADGLVSIGRDRSDIYGVITTVRDQGVNDVYVPLFKNGKFVEYFKTDESGKYEFTSQLNGRAYTVKPAKDYLDVSAINVISSTKGYDYVKYRFGVIDDPQLSPYQIITLDVNCNGKISTLDIFLINEVILGNIDEFPACAAWAFIPAEYEFPDPLDPFPFPDSASIDNLSEDTQLDFVGVMKGDVTFQADPTLPLSAPGTLENSTLQLKAKDTDVLKGDTFQLSITADNFRDLRAYQYALQFDPEALEFVSSQAEDLEHIDQDNFGLRKIQEGILRTLWVHPEPEGVALDTDKALFSITFRAKKKIYRVSDYIGLNDDEIKTFGIDSGFGVKSIGLDFQQNGTITSTRSVDSGFKLYQNTPNPFSHKTTIRFQLPSAGQAELLIYNQLGQVVWQANGFYRQGENTVQLNLNELGLGDEVLYYQLIAGEFNQVKKMVKTTP